MNALLILMGRVHYDTIRQVNSAWLPDISLKDIFLLRDFHQCKQASWKNLVLLPWNFFLYKMLFLSDNDLSFLCWFTSESMGLPFMFYLKAQITSDQTMMNFWHRLEIAVFHFSQSVSENLQAPLTAMSLVTQSPAFWLLIIVWNTIFSRRRKMESTIPGLKLISTTQDLAMLCSLSALWFFDCKNSS